jgi:hypothetical protein
MKLDFALMRCKKLRRMRSILILLALFFAGRVFGAESIYSELMSARDFSSAQTIVSAKLPTPVDVANFATGLGASRIESLPQHSAEALVLGLGISPSAINRIYEYGHTTLYKLLRLKKLELGFMVGFPLAISVAAVFFHNTRLAGITAPLAGFYFLSILNRHWNIKYWDKKEGPEEVELRRLAAEDYPSIQAASLRALVQACSRR